VLDAGCGNGRWSWTLSSLGAKVTAIDQSESCLEATRRNCQDVPTVEVRRHSLLELLPSQPQYDLVWCYGVAHHTGDTRRAIGHVAATVRPGGYLFLMIYGEPRPGRLGDFEDINEYVRLRRLLAPLSLSERVEYLKSIKRPGEVHGWFDAVSPRINDLHRLDEIAEWLRLLGFAEIRQTFATRNLHIIATRLR
jgi:SAM-dependent methyltransferase